MEFWSLQVFIVLILGINTIDRANPTRLDWRRLMVLGDSKHDILVALQPHLKSIIGVQKELSTNQLKVGLVAYIR
jgi:hypothetical protein